MIKQASDAERLAALFVQAPGMIAFTQGPDHIYEFVNAAYSNCVGRGDLVGKSVEEVQPELREQGVIALLDQVYANGESHVDRHARRVLRVAPDDIPTEFFFDLVYQPMFDEDGRTSGVFLQAQDVTLATQARVRTDHLQQNLVRNAKQSGMDSMGATLAHELNQPLTVIIATVAAARRFLQSPAEADLAAAQAALLDVEEAALRAGELIRRLRDTVSRGHVRDRQENLACIVRDVVALTAEDVRARRVALAVDVDQDILVCVDRVQLQQVFLNLINNALEAMDEVDQRRLKISATIKGSFVDICIADTGVGLSDEAGQRLFDVLYTTKPQGMGLGLSICRAIVEAHGGAIWHRREHPAGTAFCLTLPLYEADH